jgi:hypothetical protein
MRRKARIIIERLRTLHLRAVRGVRPTVCLAGAGPLTLRAGSSLALEGLLLTGAPLQIIAGKGCHISIRHCTLKPARSGAPAFTVAALGSGVTVEVESSILLGPLVTETSGARGGAREVALRITDSIVDATDAGVAPAIGASGATTTQPIRLSAQRSTILGAVAVRGVDAADSIFDGPLTVTPPPRQPRDPSPPPDSLRHCYVRETELAQAARQYCVAPDTDPGVHPRFASRRYGDPRYCRLSERCPKKIAEGAGDGGELGVYHSLHLRLRAAILRERLDEFTVAAMCSAILFAD